MAIVLNGTSGITNDSGYTGDGVSFADSTPANTLVTTSGGNVGIGTSSPARRLHALAASGDNTVAKFESGTGSTIMYLQLTANGQSNTNSGYIGYNSSNTMSFFTVDTERMRIDSSGNLLVGLNAQMADAVLSVRSSGAATAAFDRQTSDGSVLLCRRNNTTVGSINVTTSATTYATSSDYRLKHDIQPMTGALAKVAALKPVTYKWNADDSAGEGFIAHELAEVCPDAVTGEKDAVDAEGNPQYQGIDTSFLVATLTAAIQELKAINDAQAQTINAQQAALESLTARVVALETQP